MKIYYREEDIESLTLHDSVRKRPAMYFSRTDAMSFAMELIHSMVESHAGRGSSTVVVLLHEDSSITVEMDGGGVAGVARGAESSPLVNMFTAWGRSPRGSKSKLCASPGPCVAASASEWMEVESCCEGRRWTMRLDRGIISSGPTDAGPADGLRLRARALLDRTIFSLPGEIDIEDLFERCRPLAIAFPEVALRIEDLRTGRVERLAYPGGVKQRLLEISDVREAAVISLKSTLQNGDGSEAILEIAFGFHGESIASGIQAPRELYAHEYRVPLGGVPIDAVLEFMAMRAADTIGGDESPSASEIREGARLGTLVSRSLAVVMRVEHQRLSYQGSTRDYMINSDIADWAKSVVSLATPAARVWGDPTPEFWKPLLRSS